LGEPEDETDEAEPEAEEDAGAESDAAPMPDAAGGVAL
jgi:hypothetical protein